jgi:hypothetical protein
MNFKKRYEDAMQLFMQMEQNKETHQKKGSYYECQESPMHKNYSIGSFGGTGRSIAADESPVANRYSGVKNTEFIITEVNKIVNVSNKKKVDFNDFEKLKEDYFTLYEEKRVLDTQLVDYNELQQQYTLLKDSYGKLKVQYDITSEKLNHVIDEKVNYHERLNKVVRENSELLQTLHSLRESLNTSEREKNSIKNKVSQYNNKHKLIEKELNISKKKCHTLNFQIKNLTEKLNIESEDRRALEKQLEDLKDDYSNKLAILEGEKQKSLKDPFTLLMKTLEEDNSNMIELKYNSETNKIEIYFENNKVIELDNTDKRRPLMSIENTLHNIPTNYIKTETSHSYVPTYYDNKENICSPRKEGHPISLMKLFSNSSKKSFFNSASSKHKPSIIDLIPTQFSNEKNPFDLDRPVSRFDTDNKNDDKLNSCIKNTALNNMRYVFSAHPNRHRKLISLNDNLSDDEQPQPGSMTTKVRTPTFAMSQNFFSIDKRKQIEYLIETTVNEYYRREEL